MASGFDDGGGHGGPTIIHVHLTRPPSNDAPTDSSSWGFRLLATGTGVAVQSVQRGTLSDICGLLAGDELLRINGRDTVGMSLDDARAAITHAGHDVELVVQRGPTRVWQPQVTYTSHSAAQQDGRNTANTTTRRQQPTQPSSYHASKIAAGLPQPMPPPFSGPAVWSLQMPPRQEYRQVTMFNSNPRPFYLAGGSAPLDRHGNRHHHHQSMHQSAYDPRGGYCEDDLVYENRADEQRSISSGHGSRRGPQDGHHHHHHRQHPRRPYSPGNEAGGFDEDEQQSRRPSGKTGSWIRQGVAVLPQMPPFVPPPPPPPPPPQSQNQHYRSLSSGRVPRGPVVNAGVDVLAQRGGVDSSSEPPRCMACTGFVNGVFAKIRGRPIHPECFRCATCGTTLKNRGHYYINDRLYCDVHARQVEQQRSSVLY